MSWSDGFREGLGTLASVVFAAIVTALLQREQRTRAELATAHERLGEYAAQAERLAAEQERNRVARDIHDGLGHALTVVQMQVKAARAVLAADPERTDEVLAKAQDQAEAALVEVRRSVRALRGSDARCPLTEALQDLADLSCEAGVATRLVVAGDPRPLADPAREALYRVGQEGLTNVRRHARATTAELRLEYGVDAVRLAVRDDGTGAAPGDPPSGVGVLGLRERAAELGGRLALESVPGQGTTLRLEVPA
jgi:signal transduction histidine kinase